MHILFIGKRFYTNRDALIERYGRIFQLPRWWADAGHDARLWLIDYHTREYRQEAFAGLPIVSTPVGRWRFVRQLSAELSRVVRRAGRPQLVVASGDCYIGLLAYVVARLLRARFVFDLYDRYDVFEGYRRLPGFDPQTFLLRRADAVTFASVTVRDELGDETRRHSLVPNGVDREHFRPLPMADARREFGLPAAPILVGYFGSMEPERGVADLIEAVALLRDDDIDAALVIGGQAHPGVDLDRPWLHYLGNVDFQRVPWALASCDVLALPYRNSPFLDNAASCKIAEYIAAGRPIVATNTPNLMRNFEHQAKQLRDAIASPGDPAALAACLRQQIRERQLADMPDGMDWQAISNRLLAFVTTELLPERGA